MSDELKLDGKFYESWQGMSAGDKIKVGLYLTSLGSWWRKKKDGSLSEADELKVEEKVNKFQAICTKYGIDVNIMKAAMELHDYFDKLEPYVCKENPRNLVEDAPNHIPNTCRAILGDPQGIWSLINRFMPTRMKATREYEWYKVMFEELAKFVRREFKAGRMKPLAGTESMVRLLPRKGERRERTA